MTIDECSALGMVPYTDRSSQAYHDVKEHVTGLNMAGHYGLAATDAATTQNSATCTFADGYQGLIQTKAQVDHRKISGFVADNASSQDANDKWVRNHLRNNKAEVGKYLIQFHVTDNAGNHECTTRVRTVVVQDTLAPVISLHLAGHGLIHASNANDVGLNGQANPAGVPRDTSVGPHYGNPNLMAEEAASTATNGWIVGAAASAVTGLALLGYSQRKSTVTTVPV